MAALVGRLNANDGSGDFITMDQQTQLLQRLDDRAKAWLVPAYEQFLKQVCNLVLVECLQMHLEITMQVRP